MLSAKEMNSSAAKLIDKLLSHLDDDLMEQLQGHLVDKASKILNVPQMCSYLVQQNLLDADDFQLVSTTTAIRYNFKLFQTQGRNDQISMVAN